MRTCRCWCSSRANDLEQWGQEKSRPRSDVMTNKLGWRVVEMKLAVEIGEVFDSAVLTSEETPHLKII